MEVDAGLQPSKLLFWGAIKSDEILQDYLARLGFLNGFASVGSFISWLSKEEHIALCNDFGEFKKCRTLLNRCHFKLSSITKTLIPSSSLLFPLNMEELYKLYNCSAKVCPQCFKESRHYRFYWHLTEYRICHRHGCLLFEHSGNPYPKYEYPNARFQRANMNQTLAEVLIGVLDGDSKIIEKARLELDVASFEIKLIYAIKEIFAYSSLAELNIEKLLSFHQSGKLVNFPKHRRLEWFAAILSVENNVSWRLIYFNFLMVFLSSKIDKRYFNSIESFKGSDEYQLWSIEFISYIHQPVYRNLLVDEFSLLNNSSRSEGNDWSESYAQFASKLGYHWGSVLQNLWKIYIAEVQVQSSPEELMGFEKRICIYRQSYCEM